MSAELWSHGVCEASGIIPPCVEICLILAGSDDGIAWRDADGVVQEAVPRTGTIWLNPAGISKDIAITSPIPEATHLLLPASLFERLKEDFRLPDSAVNSIRNEAGIRDEVIDHLGRSILAEMMAESAVGRMYVETASLALAARLIQRYSEDGACSARETSPHRLDNVRLRRVLDFIDTNVRNEITLDDLASIAGYSPFHFARKFAATMGIPPHRYISQIRLEIAMAELAAGKLPLAEIALNAHFSSQASFTRAFHRATGVTPKDYQRRRR